MPTWGRILAATLATFTAAIAALRILRPSGAEHCWRLGASAHACCSSCSSCCCIWRLGIEGQARAAGGWPYGLQQPRLPVSAELQARQELDKGSCLCFFRTCPYCCCWLSTTEAARRGCFYKRWCRRQGGAAAWQRCT